MTWFEDEYRRRMKAMGYEPTMDGMDDQDVKDALEAMDRRNARQQDEWQYPRYKQPDPGFVARIMRMFGQPYDPKYISEEEKHYIGGWDNGDDDDDAAPQAKPAQNPFTPQQSGGKQPDKPWTLNWGGNDNMSRPQQPPPGYRPEQPGATFPSRGAVERPLIYGPGGNGADTGYQLMSDSGPASYRRDGLRMAYSQPSAADSKKYIQEWYDANVWTDPDVLAAGTPEEREAAVHRIIASRGGEGLLRHYNALHVNENDAEIAKLNDVKYVVNSLGRVQDGPDGGGPGRDNKDKLNAAIEKAINITGSFEGHAGYENVAGNADGAGLSLGKFHWNIGQETLQPMLAKFINENPEKAREIFGKNFESVASMLSGTKADQMNWARSINGNEGKCCRNGRRNLPTYVKRRSFRKCNEVK